MSIHYLVINENEDSLLLPYSERYKLFAEVEDAIKHAKSIGFETLFGSINPKPGMLNMYRCGEINVSLIGLEEQS